MVIAVLFLLLLFCFGKAPKKDRRPSGKGTGTPDVPIPRIMSNLEITALVDEVKHARAFSHMVFLSDWLHHRSSLV
jgi:hypothetical protein